MCPLRQLNKLKSDLKVIILYDINYRVTQSLANSFRGYVVLDTFNNVSRDEDNILDQIYIKLICPDFYYDDF